VQAYFGQASAHFRIKLPTAPPPPHLCTNPLPVKHPITIQDDSIEKLIYLAFRYKIMPALQASILMMRD